MLTNKPWRYLSFQQVMKGSQEPAESVVQFLNNVYGFSSYIDLAIEMDHLCALQQKTRTWMYSITYQLKYIFFRKSLLLRKLESVYNRSGDKRGDFWPKLVPLLDKHMMFCFSLKGSFAWRIRSGTYFALSAADNGNFQNTRTQVLQWQTILLGLNCE